jgi:hypothetical protein
MTAETTADVISLQRARWLAEQADWLAAHSRATELGRRARRAYLDRTQIRNLQRVAETAPAVSTLLDYVKVQVGKQPLWRRESFGTMLLDDLERLHARAASTADSSVRLHLELCRLFVRQLAAAYVYSIAVDATAPRTAPPAPRPATPSREAARPPRQRGQRSAAPRNPRSAETDAPAAEEQPADSAEPEVAAAQVASEQVEASIDTQAPGDNSSPNSYSTAPPSEAELPPQNVIEPETAFTGQAATPVTDVAEAREPGEGIPANQEEAE